MARGFGKRGFGVTQPGGRGRRIDGDPMACRHVFAPKRGVLIGRCPCGVMAAERASVLEDNRLSGRASPGMRARDGNVPFDAGSYSLQISGSQCGAALLQHRGSKGGRLA